MLGKYIRYYFEYKETEVQNINIEPIITEDQAGNRYQYFKVQNGDFADVIFAIQEISFVDDNEDGEAGKSASGRVLFEETMEFTSKQLLSNEGFGTIVRDVFDKIVQEIVTSAKELTEAQKQEAEDTQETETVEEVVVETQGE